VKEDDLDVPFTYNDGTPIEAKTIERIGQKMLERSGGVNTALPPHELRLELTLRRVQEGIARAAGTTRIVPKLFPKVACIALPVKVKWLYLS
jgi:hypothetical protein